MPAPGLRELNIEARRQRILDAARRLISEGGMPALSMRQLAREAQLSVTTLYNLFGVREEILQALVLDAIDRMDTVLEQTVPLDDPIERCRAIITVSTHYIAEQEAIFRPVLLATLESSTSRGQSSGEVTRRAASMQTLAIEAAVERGLLLDRLDPEQLGRQIYHGYQLAGQQWALGSIDIDEFEARSLYGLGLVLLGVASESLRPDFEADLRSIQKRLGGGRASRKPRARPANA
jgi:AcrR family transcriptional regulator